MNLKPLKGVKEYLPEDQIIREYIVDVLKNVFRLYGFKPIETSILDFYKIAASKYAGSAIIDEIYKLKDRGNRELALRYELTFKLAKLIGLNPNLKMPFKRYEIGKVFRDGPVKKGRLREFTQCDADAVGIREQYIDAEIISLAFNVFKKLNLDVYVRVNNIKLLYGLLDLCGVEKKLRTDTILCLDKFEKIGKDGVYRELRKKGLSEDIITKIFLYLDECKNKKTITLMLSYLENLNNELIKKAISELRELFSYCKITLDESSMKNLIFDPTLARGLAYYTGTIFEFYLRKSKIKSSIAAGGRWNNLISKFLETKTDYPAVGISFGLDVLLDAIKEKNSVKSLNIPLCLVISISDMGYSYKILRLLRNSGISSEITFKNLKKSLEYANKLKIPYVVILGSEEIKIKKIRLRDMKTGKEFLLTERSLINKLKNKSQYN